MRRMNVAVLAMACLLPVSCGCSEESKSLGGAELVEVACRPITYYPRYRISFPLESIGNGWRKSYDVSAAPAEEYDLRLVVYQDAETVSDNPSLDRISESLETSGVVARAVLTPRGGSPTTFRGDLGQDWHRTAGPEWYFSANPLTNVRLTGAFNLELEIVTARELPPGIGIRAVLAGGGIQK